MDNDEIIEIVSEIKYLGITELCFSNHIDYICRKFGKKLGFLMRVSAYWTAVVHYDYFNYRSLLIACIQRGIMRLQLQQNKPVRIILGCNRYTPIQSCINYIKLAY